MSLTKENFQCMELKSLKSSENGFYQIRKALQEIQEETGWAIDSDEWRKYAAKLSNSSWTEDDQYPDGFSLPTWKKFASGKNGKPVAINSKAFKCFCKVLGLNWEDVIDKTSEAKPEEIDDSVSVTNNKFTLPHNLPSINTWINGSRLQEIHNLKTEILNPNIRAITITSVCVVGLAGIGKTTLISRLIHELHLEATPFTAVIWESLQTPTGRPPRFDNVIDSILEKLSNGEIKPVVTLLDDYYKKTERLINLLKNNTCLLILDNIETILKTKQANQAGFFADNCPEYAWLLQKLAETEHQGKVIFTSRETLVQLTQKSHLTFKLGGLDKRSAIELLKNFELNASEEELEALVTRYEGHPKALEIVAAFIRDDIEFRGIVSQFLADTNWLLVNTLDALLEQIINRMSSEEIVCLSHISVYETSEYSLLSDGIYAQMPDQNKKHIKEKIIEALKRRQILDFNVDKNSYQMHPLIHEKASDLLNHDSLIKAHYQAYNYFISIAKPESERKNFNDIKPFLRAFYHAYQAKDYDKAAKAMLEIYPQLRQWSYFDLIENNLIQLVPQDIASKLIQDNYIYNDILCCLGVNYEALGKRNLALQLLEKSLLVSLDINDKQRHAKTLSYIGLIYETMGEPQKAIEYFEKTLAIIPSQTKDYQTEYRALSQTGIAYLALGQYNLSIKFFERSLNVARANSFMRGEAVALGNLGDTYVNLENPELAVEYSRKFFDFTQNDNNPKSRIFALIILAQSYNCVAKFNKVQDEYKKAIDILQESLKMSKEIQNPMTEAKSLLNLGIAYQGLGDDETSIRCFIAAKNIYKDHNDIRENANCLYQIALVYIKQDKFQEAVSNLKESLSLFNTINNYANKKAIVLFELAKIQLIIYNSYTQVIKNYLDEAEIIAQSLNLPILENIIKFKTQQKI